MRQDLADLLADFDADAPLERAATVPASWYASKEVADQERRQVFGSGWHFVGRAEQTATPGAYLTAEIAGVPIVVVRDEHGKLRAFENVCRHRAARVVPKECGVATRLRCPYHGWTYDLAGCLRGVPEFDGVEGFHRDDNGLAELPVETWGPWLFVQTGGDWTSLAEHLAPLPDYAERMQLDRFRFHARRTYDLGCNWKVFVDNYLDGGYHVNSIHPGLAGVLDYREYTTTVHGWTALQSSPLRAPDPAKDDASAAAVRVGDAAYYWWVFPNFMINVAGETMDTNWVLPLGVDRCRVVFDFYFTESTAPAFAEESVRVGEQIQNEDVGICEDVQRGLSSGRFHTGRFSVRREIAGHRFHCLLAQRLRTPAE